MRGITIIWLCALSSALSVEPVARQRCMQDGTNMPRPGCITASGGNDTFPNSSSTNEGHLNHTEGNSLNGTAEMPKANETMAEKTIELLKTKAKRAISFIQDWHPFGSNGSVFAAQSEMEEKTTAEQTTQLPKARAKRTTSEVPPWHPFGSGKGAGFALQSETEEQTTVQHSNATEERRLNETAEVFKANETMIEQTTQLPKTQQQQQPN